MFKVGDTLPIAAQALRGEDSLKIFVRLFDHTGQIYGIEQLVHTILGYYLPVNPIVMPNVPYVSAVYEVSEPLEAKQFYEIPVETFVRSDDVAKEVQQFIDSKEAHHKKFKTGHVVSVESDKFREGTFTHE